jgi:hypothetical protein
MSDQKSPTTKQKKNNGTFLARKISARMWSNSNSQALFFIVNIVQDHGRISPLHNNPLSSARDQDLMFHHCTTKPRPTKEEYNPSSSRVVVGRQEQGVSIIKSHKRCGHQRLITMDFLHRHDCPFSHTGLNRSHLRTSDITLAVMSDTLKCRDSGLNPRHAFLGHISLMESLLHRFFVNAQLGGFFPFPFNGGGPIDVGKINSGQSLPRMADDSRVWFIEKSFPVIEFWLHHSLEVSPGGFSFKRGRAFVRIEQCDGPRGSPRSGST